MRENRSAPTETVGDSGDPLAKLPLKQLKLPKLKLSNVRGSATVVPLGEDGSRSGAEPKRVSIDPNAIKDVMDRAENSQIEPDASIKETQTPESLASFVADSSVDAAGLGSKEKRSFKDFRRSFSQLILREEKKSGETEEDALVRSLLFALSHSFSDGRRPSSSSEIKIYSEDTLATSSSSPCSTLSSSSPFCSTACPLPCRTPSATTTACRSLATKTFTFALM